MADISYIPSNYGIKRVGSDIGLITSGSVVFGVEPTNDNFTVEKITSTFTLVTSATTHPDAIYELMVERNPDTSSYPGDLTIKTYNVAKVDGTNDQRVLLTTHTNSSANVIQDRSYLIQGLGIGEGKINLGFAYATDVATTQTVYYKLYRI